MKTTLVLAVLVAFTNINTAKADGFKCEGATSGVSVKVYNHTQPTDGTRTAAIMIVSDPTAGTLAKFTDGNNTLAYLGNGLFQAKVDLRYNESNKKDAVVAGTKLADLKNINLQVYSQKGFGFGYDVAKMFANGQTLDATLTYLNRNGETLEEKANCTRYLKNDLI